MLFKLSVRDSENPLLLLAPTIMDSLRVAAMDEIYFSVAIALSNSENPRTETAFQDLLVQKVYTFFFCNSFFSLFYISFIKKHIEGCTPSGEELDGMGAPLPTDKDCMYELQSAMATVFIVREGGVAAAATSTTVLRSLRCCYCRDYYYYYYYCTPY